MPELDANQLQAFSAAVQSASSRQEVALAVKTIYQTLQHAIELRQPVCVASGRCCRFDEFGHRLFVTTMELGTFLQDLRASTGILSFAHPPGPLCPFQADKLCSVHAIRPLGCRIFFCDETSTQWQREQYERFHAHLKRLHEELNVPYFYMEWREALAWLISCRFITLPLTEPA